MALVLNSCKGILNRLLVSSSNHDKTNTIGSCLTDDSRVSIILQSLLKLSINLLICCSHSDESKTQTDSVLHSLVLATVAVAVYKVVTKILRVLVLVDKTVRKIGTSSHIG